MANRYWIGVNDAWTDTANWSETSGGAGGASVPGASDVAIFDANSGSGSVNVTSAPATSLDATNSTNSFAGFFLPLVGNATLGAGITGWTVGTLSAQGPVVLTTNGVSVNAVSSAIGGTLTLGDDLTCTQLSTTQDGNLITNGNNVTTTNLTLGGTGDVELGSSVIVVSSLFTSAGFTGTLNAGTSIVHLFQSGINSNVPKDASFAANTSWNILRIHRDVNLKTPGMGINATVNVNEIQFSPEVERIFGDVGLTLNFQTFTAEYTGALLISVGLRNPTYGSTFTMSSPNNLTLENVALKNCVATGGGVFTANDSFDLGGNTGWTITSSGSSPTPMTAYAYWG